jgi:hypothetical protein
MSYTIIKIVYGVPLTEDCIDLINKWESDPNSDKWFEDGRGVCGFISLYSASGPGHGYCGVELDELKSYGNEPVSDIRMKPTAEEKEKAKKLVDKLDPELRKLTGKIDVYFIWSDA